MASFIELREAVDDYLQHLKDCGHHDRDDRFVNDIFEKAVEFIYGDKAFETIRELCDRRDNTGSTSSPPKGR